MRGLVDRLTTVSFRSGVPPLYLPRLRHRLLAVSLLYVITAYSLQYAFELFSHLAGARHLSTSGRVALTGFKELVCLLVVAAYVIWRRIPWARLGVNTPRRWRALHLLWLPALYGSLWIDTLFPSSAMGRSVGVEAWRLTPVLLFSNLMVGAYEELVSRGVALYETQELSPLRAALFSAAIFGAAHLVNLTHASPGRTLVQVLYTFLLGLGFAAVRLRTNTLWPLILIHGLIDFGHDLGSSQAGGPGLGAPVLTSSFLNDVKQTFPAALACLPLGLYGLFLLRPKALRRGLPG